jgi:TolB-like protein
MRKGFVTVASALAIAGISQPVRAQAASPDLRPTVAVMDFGNSAIGPGSKDMEPLSKGMAGMLISELGSNPGIRVVERDQLEKIMSEQNLSTSGRVDPATAVRVGKLLGVHHMIFGSFVTDGRGTMRIDARAVNVETSVVEHTETVQGKDANLMQLVNDLAAKLNSGLKLPEIPKPVREASAATAKKVPLEAAMLYSRALAAKDGGRNDEALQLLSKSLEKFPDYEPAKKERDKLQGKSE